MLRQQRVAGTSFEMALSEYLEEDDISTPAVAYDEKKAQENRSPGPQNFYQDYKIRKRTMVIMKGLFN